MGYSWVPLRVTVCLIRLSPCDCKQTSEYSAMGEIPQTGCLTAYCIHCCTSGSGSGGKRRDVCELQSHRPSRCKCFAGMKYRTSIYYPLAAAHEDVLRPLTITVYMRHRNLLPPMDASVWVGGHARLSWLADENESGYKQDFISLALSHHGHLQTLYYHGGGITKTEVSGLITVFVRIGLFIWISSLIMNPKKWLTPQNEFSKSEFSKSEFSKSEFSKSEFSKSEFSKSEFCKSEFYSVVVSTIASCSLSRFLSHIWVYKVFTVHADGQTS